MGEHELTKVMIACLITVDQLTVKEGNQLMRSLRQLDGMKFDDIENMSLAELVGTLKTTMPVYNEKETATA